MELLGSYAVQGYTVEAYFPGKDDLDAWKLCVIRDGRAIAESRTWRAVKSVYGVDEETLRHLEAAADFAVAEVIRREAIKEGGLDHRGKDADRADAESRNTGQRIARSVV